MALTYLGHRLPTFYFPEDPDYLFHRMLFLFHVLYLLCFGDILTFWLAYFLGGRSENISARGIREASVRLLKDIPEAKKQTITYDNGLEFAAHELTEKQTHHKAFFANPYHSWERGTNKNTNGLVRRYFPKGTVFSKIDTDYFKRVIEKLNHRPRRRLGYRTPFEVFFAVNLRIVR